MNFFKLYIGDYQRDTAHLSIAEHGAYMLMLQHYYATEKPLPSGKALHRMLRAQDKAERDAIDAVSSAFWTETEAGLVNERADVEITKASAQADTNARIAREREDKRKAARERHEQSTNRATNDQPNQTPDTKEKKKQTDADASVVVSVAADRLACPHQQIIDAWSELLPELPAPRVWSQTRMKHLQARWREQCKAKRWESQADGVAWFRKLFGYIRQSAFLMGESPRGEGHEAWNCTLPWAIESENFAKIIEGNYHKDAA